jgi:hypothetical protein
MERRRTPAEVVNDVLSAPVEPRHARWRTTVWSPRAPAPHGYLASPPEVALDSLVALRTDELAQVRVFAEELQGEFRRAAAGDG